MLCSAKAPICAIEHLIAGRSRQTFKHVQTTLALAPWCIANIKSPKPFTVVQVTGHPAQTFGLPFQDTSSTRVLKVSCLEPTLHGIAM